MPLKCPLAVEGDQGGVCACVLGGRVGGSVVVKVWAGGVQAIHVGYYKCTSNLFS